MNPRILATGALLLMAGCSSGGPDPLEAAKCYEGIEMRDDHAVTLCRGTFKASVTLECFQRVKKAGARDEVAARVCASST